MDTESIRERIGLDFLLEKKEKDTTYSSGRVRVADSIAASAITSLAKLILQTVRKSEGTEGAGIRLEDVGAAASLDARALLPLARRLEDVGLLKVITPDPWGPKETVTLSEKGVAALEKPSDAELSELLGLA